MKADNTLKDMSKNVTTVYSGYIKSNPKKINLNQVNLPKKVREAFFALVKKYKGVFYGTIITVSNVPKTRNTSDMDCYLPKAKIYLVLKELDKLFGDKVRYSKRHFGIVKIECLHNGKWIEVADIGELEAVQKKNGKFSVTTEPLKINTKNKPVIDYNGVRGQTLEVQHQRKINGAAFSASNPIAKKKRFGKDAFDMGVLNRYTIAQLVALYKKNHDIKLKATLTKLLKNIVEYSTREDVIKARREFENACVKNGLCNVRLFDGKHTKQLNLIKEKLKKGTFNLDKDLKLVDKMVTPSKVEKKTMTCYKNKHYKKDPQTMTAFKRVIGDYTPLEKRAQKMVGDLPRCRL